MSDEAISTGGDAGESTLNRIERFLSSESTPVENPKQPQEAQSPAVGEDDLSAEVQDIDAQGDEQGGEADAPEQTEEPHEYQLSDVAKLLGADESSLDIDEDGSILVKTKVDGELGKVKFNDLVKSYQLQQHVDRQVREAAEQRKFIQEQSAQLQQQAQVQQALTGQMAELKAIETEIGQYANLDWNALIDADPVQAVKLDRHYRDLQSKYQSKQSELNQLSAEAQNQMKAQRDAILQVENQALLKSLPDWADQTKASTEKQAIKEDLKLRGYTDAEIKGLIDHKTVLLARDAMLYRQQQASAIKTDQKVRSAPKLVRPGSTGVTASRQDRNVQNLKTAIKKSSGNKQSVVDYLLATGIA